MEYTTEELQKIEKRFWAKVHKTEGCWEWTASTDKRGAGKFTIYGWPYLAHRVAYRITYGCEPSNQVIRICRNPSCVRPDHLVDEVMPEAWGKGHIRQRRGLTPQNVREIRSKLYGVRGEIKRIASEYNVSQGVITDIKTGRSYKWVQEEENANGINS